MISSLSATAAAAAAAVAANNRKYDNNNSLKTEPEAVGKHEVNHGKADISYGKPDVNYGKPEVADTKLSNGKEPKLILQMPSLQCISESLQEEVTQTSQIQAQVRIQLQPARLHQQ